MLIGGWRNVTKSANNVRNSAYLVSVLGSTEHYKQIELRPGPQTTRAEKRFRLYTGGENSLNIVLINLLLSNSDIKAGYIYIHIILMLTAPVTTINDYILLGVRYTLPCLPTYVLDVQPCLFCLRCGAFRLTPSMCVGVDFDEFYGSTA